MQWKHTFTTNQIFVTRVKSMQHTITHSKQDKSTEFNQLRQKKNCHLQPKKLPFLLTIAGAIILYLRGFSMQYIIKSQSSTVIQTCHTVAQPQQTRVISLYRDYCTRLSQSLDGMWSILNMFQCREFPQKTNSLVSAIGCILITVSKYLKDEYFIIKDKLT